MYRALGAAAAGALAAGLFEGIMAPSTDRDAAVLLSAAGIWSLLAPALFLAVIVVDAVWHAPASVALRADMADPERRPVHVAHGLLFGLSGAALLGGLGTMLGVLRPRLTDLTLLVPLAVVCAGCLLVVLGVTAALIAPLIRRGVERWAPGPRAGRVAMILSAMMPALIVVGPMRWLGRDLPPLPFALLAFGLAVTVAVRVGWARAPRWMPLASIGLAIAIAVIGLRLYDGVPAARSALMAGQGMVPALVGAVHRAVDADRDGASPLLAGGDCDDGDPAIHPMAVDLPGNGIDEDCAGGDARPSPGRVRPVLARPEIPSALIRRWNVLLITIDTLRADRLPLYGYDRDIAPNLTRLGERAWVVERAYTPANSTRYALPGLFAGRPLAYMEVDWLGRYLSVRPGNGLLFERVSAAGYRTEAYLPLRATESMWFGLEAGVDVWSGRDDIGFHRSSPALNRVAKGRLSAFAADDSDAPWAMWLHYLEPHEPYRPDPTFRDGDSPSALYDAEIATVDDAIGELMAHLEATGFADDTVVVITSDHGEEFGEHGRRYHGKQLYEESVRIPLIIAVPGAAPRRISTPATLLDIAPTLAHLLDLPPALDFGARSLAGWGAGTEAPRIDRAIHLACVRNQRWPATHSTALLSWPLKAISAGAARMLFDLEADPGETQNLAVDGTHPLLDALARRDARERLAARQGMLANAVSRSAPSALASVEPIPIVPGLNYFGAVTHRLDLGSITPLRVDAYLGATDTDRPDLRFEFAVYDAKGEQLTRTRARPLAGLHGTRQFEAGTVIRESYVVRVSEGVAEPLRVTLAALDGGDVVWGPIEVSNTGRDRPLTPENE